VTFVATERKTTGSYVGIAAVIFALTVFKRNPRRGMTLLALNFSVVLARACSGTQCHYVFSTYSICAVFCNGCFAPF
jgi:hypothetical protein